MTFSKNNFVLARHNKNFVEYNGTSGSRHRLSFKNEKVYHRGYGCTCSYFVKNAICSHLVGYDLVFGLNLFEIKGKSATFVNKNKTGRKSNRVIDKINPTIKFIFCF